MVFVYGFVRCCFGFLKFSERFNVFQVWFQQMLLRVVVHCVAIWSVLGWFPLVLFMIYVTNFQAFSPNMLIDASVHVHQTSWHKNQCTGASVGISEKKNARIRHLRTPPRIHNVSVERQFFYWIFNWFSLILAQRYIISVSKYEVSHKNSINIHREIHMFGVKWIG